MFIIFAFLSLRERAVSEDEAIAGPMISDLTEFLSKLLKIKAAPDKDGGVINFRTNLQLLFHFGIYRFALILRFVEGDIVQKVTLKTESLWTFGV